MREIEKQINDFNIEINDMLLHSVNNVKNLYHYTSPNSLKGILETNSLWFTDSEFLNDKTEGKHIYSLIEKNLENLDQHFVEMIQKYILGINLLEFFNINSFEEYFNNELNKKYKNNSKYFTFSFSNDNDNLSLWNYYTKTSDSIGYNIGFDMQKLNADFRKQSVSKFISIFIFKVIYEEQEQLKIINKILNKYNELWLYAVGDDEKDSVFREFFNLINFIKFYFKHPAFKFEDEIKVIAKMNNEKYHDLIRNDSDIIKFRIQNGIFIPYIDININYENNYVISSIKISPSNKQDNAEHSLRELLYKNHIIYCDIYKSNIPLR